VALVRDARRLARRQGVVESFLQEFGLSTPEGLALMCLAEALLRTPDEATRDRADRREDRLGRLGQPRRPLRQPVRQRRDLGPDAHRPPGRAGRDARRDLAGFLRRLAAGWASR
jgi:RHH-type proline utilization regulon transcriptional repressor/proline dehydrogenase/delta 1-pyrroline-5-carboxylate dehydrogenase